MLIDTVQSSPEATDKDALAELKRHLFPEIEFDGISFIHPRSDQLDVCTARMCMEIIKDGRKIARVITIRNGGMTSVRKVADQLRVRGDIASMRIESYTGVNAARYPVIKEGITCSVEGQNILLTDDVNDTGNSLAVAVDYLKGKGAENIIIATLGHKPHSSITPDYYGFETSAWIIYPHETREFMEEKYKQWRTNGLSLENITNRFRMIRLPTEEIDFFVPLFENEYVGNNR